MDFYGYIYSRKILMFDVTLQVNFVYFIWTINIR